MHKHATRFVMILLGLLLTPLAAADDPAGNDPSRLPAQMLPRAVESLLLDFTESDQRAIAVGERGTILVSESRSDWRQVASPTRSNLNAVFAVGAAVWAVGQDGVIVHSADGGLTWVLQRSDPWHQQGMDEPFDPRLGVPLLDILMFDESHGLAIGAYALILRTDDGGQHWERIDLAAITQQDEEPADAESAADAEAGDDDSWTFDADELELEGEVDPHLNAIAQTGSGGLLIVAERGAAYRSRDQGQHWERLQLPYEGSMFGVLGFAGDHVLAYGMRGHVLESQDLGDTWVEHDTGTEASLMGGVKLPNAGVALVGANGALLVRSAADADFRLYTYQTSNQETPTLAAVLAQSATQLIVGGEKGTGVFHVPSK